MRWQHRHQMSSDRQPPAFVPADHRRLLRARSRNFCSRVARCPLRESRIFLDFRLVVALLRHGAKGEMTLSDRKRASKARVGAKKQNTVSPESQLRADWQRCCRKWPRMRPFGRARIYEWSHQRTPSIYLPYPLVLTLDWINGRRITGEAHLSLSSACFEA